MKKFDFSKEFGNIDSKYISEAEEEWKGKKEHLDTNVLEQSGSSMRDRGIGLRNFFKPEGTGRNEKSYIVYRRDARFSQEYCFLHRSIKHFSDGQRNYRNLKEVVLDDGVLLAKVPAEKTASGQEAADPDQGCTDFCKYTT